MPRNNRKGRKRHNDTSLTFKEICRKAGITPMQRILLVREMRKERGER